VPTSEFRCAIPNVKRYMKTNRWEIGDVATSAFEGDYNQLEMLLSTGDESNLFNGDLNEHVGTFSALHLAAQSGHADCIELLLKAKADPHIRERMPFGQDPEDGRTALDVAKEQGWDDCAEVLESGEKATPYGWYVPVGLTNNAKVYNTFEWGKKPPKGWYMSRPGAARKQGLDPKKYGAMDFEDLDPDLAVVAEAQPPPPTVKPLPIGLLFPGQGSQYVKMLSTSKDIPAVADMLRKATAILGFDVLKVCLEGPEEELERTSVCQPAMLLAGLAGVEKLRADRDEAVSRCQVLAGLSLGEYTALCVAGVFTFEDALRLVQLRGQAMEEAANTKPQQMLSVAGLERAKLQDLCVQAAKFEGGDAVCQIANELFPKGFSCGGTQKAIQQLKTLATNAGALQAKELKTSGGFHTSLMQPAADKLGKALDEVVPKMKPPRCPVYMNVSATPIKKGTPAREIASLLKKQMTSPVLWEASVKAAIADGVLEFYEVGPMKQLKAMMKRIDQKLWNQTYCVDV